jgi:3-mercaptopyruvate sulfurtransferase SseA
VYCASGYRSLIAASVLRSAGFADVSDLLGGYLAWEGAGLPVVTDEAVTVTAVPEVSGNAVHAVRVNVIPPPV